MTEESARIDALCSKWNREDSPGCVVGVVKDGAHVHLRAYGMADLERQVPLGPDSVFDIGSTSKQFTAMCILLLAREGKVTLDDDIRRFLPELHPYCDTITIRHLIHHTSGLRDYLDLMVLSGWRMENAYPEAEVLDLIGRQEHLNFPPGGDHVYSNTGYFLLSLIVKRTTGMSLRAYAEQNIFAPLGMTHTHFHDDWSELVEGRALGYAPAGDNGYRLALSWSELLGDGAVYTTVEDLFRWDANFYANRLAGGDDRLVPDLLETGTLNDGARLHYAGGVMIQPYRSRTMHHHGGAWAGYRAEYIRFPEERLSVVCLSNLGNFNSSLLARQVADIYLDAGEEPAGSADSQADADPTGTYYSARTDGIRTIEQCDGRFLLGPGLDRALQPLGGNRWRVEGTLTDLALAVAPDGAIAALQEIAGGRVAAEYEPISTAGVRADRGEELAGSYRSAELDATYVIAHTPDGLVLSRPGAADEVLTPTIPDGSHTPHGMHLVFARDGGGQVRGFRLSTARVRRLSFEKVGHRETR